MPDPPGTAEPSQSFVQHPLSGICTMSTGQWTAGLGEPLPCFADDRPNALSGGASYASAPLSSDLRLSGPIAARLWVTTTAADAAVTVRVDDVARRHLDGDDDRLADRVAAGDRRDAHPSAIERPTIGTTCSAGADPGAVGDCASLPVPDLTRGGS